MSLYDLLVLKEELVKVRQLETDAVYSKGFHTSLLQAVGSNINALIMVVLNIWHGLILCNKTELSVEQNSLLLHASHLLQYLCQSSVIVFGST